LQHLFSGGKPKKPHQIKSIALLLGPDFASDVIVIETSDHTRLQLHVRKLMADWLRLAGCSCGLIMAVTILHARYIAELQLGL
jgi:hypothetical protein